MSCIGTGPMTEYEFIMSISDRQEPTCRGPLVQHTFSAQRTSTIEETLPPTGVALLWSGHRPQFRGRLTFELCAMHWFDIAAMVSARGMAIRCAGLIDESSALLHLTARRAGWDLKEFSNLLRRPSVRLT